MVDRRNRKTRRFVEQGGQLLKSQGENLLVNLSVKTVLVTGPLLLAVQAASAALPSVPELTWIGQIRDAGLVGALLVAVYTLWKSREALLLKIDSIIEKKEAGYAEKDNQILKMMEHVTTTLATQVETNRELRKTLEESVHAKEALAVSISQLKDGLFILPCVSESVEGFRKRMK